MSSIAKSFTATGDGLELVAPAGTSIGYAVAGTFVGTVVLQEYVREWVTLQTFTSVTRGSFAAEPKRSMARYRFKCTAFTSGTIVTTLDTAVAGALSGVATVRQASVELTDAQIKTLGATTPVTIVAAPGLNRILLPVSGIMRRVMLAAYTNVNAAATLFLSDGGGTIVHSNSVDADFLIAFTDTVATFQPAALYQTLRSTLENSALTIQGANAAAGAFTGGNAANRLIVTVSYLVFNVETGRFE
jgi:hypothetical protein